MELLFVRHGQTAYNKRHAHQPPEAPLTKAGATQARAVATEIAQFTPTHLLCSSMWRAIETAHIASSEVELTPEVSDLFMELNRPPHLFGFHHFGIRSLLYIWQWFFDGNPKYWEEYGGESRAVFLERITMAKDYLQTFPDDARIVVVSHSILINFFVTHICDEKPIPAWRALLLLIKINGLKNAEAIRINYEPDAAAQVCAWTVIKPPRAK